MSKKNNSNKKFSITNPIARTPNWTATILVLIILAVAYCYFGDDIMAFNQATADRRELSNQVAQEILYNEELDMQFIQEEMNRINQCIQDLNDSTDLGEYFATNDLTVEGRQKNANINRCVNAIIVIFIGYFVMNFLRIFWWATRKTNKTSKADKGKFEKGNNADSQTEMPTDIR